MNVVRPCPPVNENLAAVPDGTARSSSSMDQPPAQPGANAPATRRQDAVDWCRGRYWHWRGALLVLLGLGALRALRDDDYAGLFAGITFGVHELGHLVFAPFGLWMSVAGGSLAQLLLPIAAGALMLHYRDYFGAAVTGVWLSASLSNMAVYVADARARELTLLGFGEDPLHDWAYLLSSMGLLQADLAVARFVRLVAFVVLVLSVGVGAWLCLTMARSRPALEAASA